MLGRPPAHRWSPPRSAIVASTWNACVPLTSDTDAVRPTRSAVRYATTSSGQRLNFWRRALQAIAEKPLYGHGVGSWNREYRRLENDNPSPVTAQVRNPHQEYLLWGVHLGVGGVLVFLAFLLALLRDARAFSPALRRATGSAVAVLAVACLFNSSLFDALIGEFFCIVLGLLLAFGRQERPAGPAS